jgi:fibronectin-binding autotransporter adhesin
MQPKNSPICNTTRSAGGIDFQPVMRTSRHHLIFLRFVARLRCASARLAAGALMAGLAANAFANPTGMTVVSGSATVQQSGPQLNVNVGSPAAFLNWSSFNIQLGETTIFNQPSANSVVFNNIGGASASQIYGSLQANGTVVLMNPSGFYFGPNSFVKVGGSFIATTAQLAPQNGGGSWEFNGPPPLASIVNYGKIEVGNGKSAFLIAENIENHGAIIAPGGDITLAAGQKVVLSDSPDGRGISVQVNLPDGSVDNEGKLIADAGTISANARVVNQNGLIQANSVRNVNGVIELVASDQLNLGANSQITANGDDSTAGSSGGSITLQSGIDFSDSDGGKISANGGAQGGDGGNVEISAPNVLSLNSKMDADAQPGWTAGKLLLDPDYIILDESGGDSAGSGTVAAGDNPGGTLDLNVYGAFGGFSQIVLQAKNDITLADGTLWSLSDATGAGGGQLTLEAGRDIIFGDQSAIYDANGWSVTLKAGVNDFNAGTVQPGVGNIFLNGGSGQNLSGSIAMNSGSIDLTAGQDIQIGSGSVTTSGGGGISATALAGSVNTGTDTGGFTFNFASSRNDTLYQVDASFPGNLGGISTAGGGDVSITAGLDIISFLPRGTITTDAGSGAFGGGNVTLNAGRDVEGHFIVANGAGVINAGRDAGNSSSELALSLIDGGWMVNAGQDILLQEVRNPNGIFNKLGFSGSTTEHYFDYAPDDYVILDAGNSVTLSGDSAPRNSGSFEQNIPSIYPSTLNITAGAGGIILGNKTILFPSPQGGLDITTTGGGPFTGTLPGDLTQLIMSDSAQAQYTSSPSFGPTDHAAVPVHLNNVTPVTLNISGDMDNILLTMPEAAQINVGGNMNNTRFTGQNLKDSDVTSITVAGDILNRNEFTSITVAAPPDLSLLIEAVPSPFTDLFSRLHYDPATQTLTFQGRMNSAQLSALQGLQLPVLDQFGFPETDIFGNPITHTVSILDSASALALFNATQNVPLNPGTGYVLGGGGQFDIAARNLDLGATLGIQSVGPANNASLANYFTRGADINVNLSGNLEMFSTTISSENGGNVFVDAGGHVNVGSTTFAGNDDYARGIFTVADSPITVIAGGDIELNGSRIATYDGGDILVESLGGEVDAGQGGESSVAVQEIFVNPVSRAVESYTPRISGSGILAITFPTSFGGLNFPASVNTVGDILVETPQGDIITSAGGVVQVSLNGVGVSAALVTLLAGKGTGGNILSPGRNIDASSSGVIGSNVKLDASGNITGLVFARNNLNIIAQQNVNVTALAGGTATVSAGDTISGTIIAGGGINASGSSVDASLLTSGSIATSGDSSGAQKGFAQGSAGDAASQGLANDASTKAAASSDDSSADDKKKNKPVALAQKVSRVTVVLPPKGKS